MTASPWLPGLPHGAVFLAEPTREWTRLFAEEAGRIRSALGPVVLGLEHYGSTSVPGIKAKPVIDLLVGLRRLDDALDHVGAMEVLGYDFAPHAGVPQHHVFGRGLARTHLAHFVEYGGASWIACLAFRDRLRGSPGLARAYEALKISLAERYSMDRAAYTAGKSEFVERVLAG